MRSPRPQSTTGLYWLIITFVLLLIAASRLLRLHEFRLNPDEVWSVWQTFGTFDQILHWTPYDWPPLYYLTVGVWWRGTSLVPESLRLLSMLIFMLGAAFSYKIGQRLSGHGATGTIARSIARQAALLAAADRADEMCGQSK